MAKKVRADPSRRRAAAVQAAASKALESLLQPLAGFVLGSGLSVRELEVLFRSAAVWSVAERQRASGHRVNISGIAAITGIPRAEISQILKAPKRAGARRPTAPAPINRVLAAWHDEPGYQKPNGKPADLRVFGPAPSFEALVNKHGAGLPVRAIFDELVRLGASDMIGTRAIRAKSFAAIVEKIESREIGGFSKKVARLFSILSNLENSEGYDFLSGITAADISSSQLPIFRREVAARTADFISAMRDNLTATDVSPKAKEDVGRKVVNLTIMYQEGRTGGPKNELKELRRNLRRLCLYRQ